MLFLQNIVGNSFTGSRFISDFLSDKVLDTGIMAVTLRVQGIALFLLAMFVLVNLANNFIKSSLQKKSVAFELSELYRSLSYALLVVVYPGVFVVVGMVITGINNMSMVNDRDYETYKGVVEKTLLNDRAITVKLDSFYVDNGQVAGDNDNDQRSLKGGKTERENYVGPDGKGRDSDSIFSIWTNMSLGISAIIAHALQAIAVLVKSIMMVLMSGVFKLMFIVGPLAVAFSILPWFREQFNVWFATLCVSGLTFTTINIIDHVMTYSLAAMFKARTMVENLNIEEATAFNVVWAVMYLLAPWATSKWVGSGSADAGKILSSAADVASRAMMARFGGPSGNTQPDTKKSESSKLADAGSDAIFKNKE